MNKQRVNLELPECSISPYPLIIMNAKPEVNSENNFLKPFDTFISKPEKEMSQLNHLVNQMCDYMQKNKPVRKPSIKTRKKR